MRNLIAGFILLISTLTYCQDNKIRPNSNCNEKIRLDSCKIALLQDSIGALNKRQFITKDQFIKIYKYDRLYKYYQICNKKPSQWIYYKGWSIRVFNQ